MVKVRLTDRQVRILTLAFLLPLFVITIGLGYITDNIANDSHTTRKIVEGVTNPQAQEQQAGILKTLIQEECKTRYIVERYITTLEPDEKYIARCVAEAYASLPNPAIVVTPSTTTTIPK